MPSEKKYAEYPGHTADGAKRYIEQGIIPGGFLTAVIENNLSEAFSRADDWNLKHLQEIVEWWYWNAPAVCWGSPKKKMEWNKHKGMSGLEDREAGNE